ncbi:MAG TPA: universal stress protein [Actinoplanes sp.]|nr:universal stress protein [Actinoplanes sp.]
MLSSVVVGVDGSAPAEEALVWALGEGRLRGLPVRAVHVWQPAAAAGPERDVTAGLERDVTAGVRAVVERSGATDLPVAADVRPGHPARELIRAAGADALLVVGSRGRGGFAGSVLGSVSQSCAQYADGTVVVVRGDRPDPAARRVVVGVDGSAHSVRALRFAHDAAARRGAVLEVVHTWNPSHLGFASPVPWSQDLLDEVAAEATATLRESVRRGGIDRAAARVRTYLMQGPPAPSLLEVAAGADLLVVGSRGYGGWKGLLLGSVSTQCVTRAPCPVAVTRDRDEAHTATS